MIKAIIEECTKRCGSKVEGIITYICRVRKHFIEKWHLVCTLKIHSISKKREGQIKHFFLTLSHPQLLPSPILDSVAPDLSHSSVNILNSLAPLLLHLVCLAKPSQLSPKPLQLTFWSLLNFAEWISFTCITLNFKQGVNTARGFYDADLVYSLSHFLRGLISLSHFLWSPQISIILYSLSGDDSSCLIEKIKAVSWKCEKHPCISTATSSACALHPIASCPLVILFLLSCIINSFVSITSFLSTCKYALTLFFLTKSFLKFLIN